jgi:hypothetical protein
MDKKHSEAYYDTLKVQPLKDLSLAEVAEMWCYKYSNNIPDRNTPEWEKMYIDWLAFAFT